MRVRILGSAAGGGYPQWNCACSNCRGLRSSAIRSRARTQSQAAVSSDGVNWHLLNASPDLRQQILNYPDLQAQPGPARNSPLKSVLLTNADIDHTLGLLLLRESQPLKIYATPLVGDLLQESNAYFRMLNQFDGHTDWQRLSAGERFELSGPEGFTVSAKRMASGITGEIYPLGGTPPFWAKNVPLAHQSRSPSIIGVILENTVGRRLGYFPGVAEINESLIRALSSCDIVLFDGTFWDDRELARLHPGSRTARQMQHVPISGPEGSLATLAVLPRHIRKIYTHINNTNPILNEEGFEFRSVIESGWEISYDGMEFMLE
ncbi:MAG: pyrroloquinoline quinone biosynthesis protein PqqB [Bdellovibrionales bacterium]